MVVGATAAPHNALTLREDRALRLRVVHKLFLLMLLLVGTAMGVLGLLAAMNLRHGFVGYINQVELQRLAPVARAITAHVAAGGNLHDYARPPRWNDLLHAQLGHPHRPPASAPRPAAPQPTRAPRAPANVPPPPEPPAPPAPPAAPAPPQPPPPPAGLEHRVTLLDLDRQPVAGPPPAAHALKQPLDVHGRRVGWLALNPLHGPADPRDVAFLHTQLRDLAWTAALLLVLSLIVALGFARHLLSPLRRVTRATARLAGGDFSVHEHTRRRDELGDLLRHVNHVAEALARHEGARRRWMADMSHELRTPLAILRGEIEAMQDGVRTPTPAAIDSLHEEIMRLHRLVGDLHQLAMSDLGALSYQRRRVDAAKLVRSAAARFDSRMREAGLAMQVSVPATPLPALLDPDRIVQLLDNLLENSLRYTDRGGRIHLSLERCGDGMALTLQDSAPGVPEAELARLFEPLYRTEASRDRRHGGSGLGLAICRNIVLAHGGRIEARPSASGGLLIRIELPAGED